MASKKNGNDLVGLKVLTAVLEERFKNQREHYSNQFNDFKQEVRVAFSKGSRRMDEIEDEQIKPLKVTVEKNSKQINDFKVVSLTIGSIFGAVGGFIVWLSQKIFKWS